MKKPKYFKINKHLRISPKKDTYSKEKSIFVQCI